MPNARYDFGIATSIEAEAMGEPGQRRFRLIIESQGGNACLWLEKTQLIQLALVIGQVLQVPPSSKYSESGSNQYDRPEHQNPSSIEFDVGNISLGYDPEQDMVSIEAHNRGDDEHIGPMLRVWTSREQLTYLSNQSQEVCAAGRPICQLCHTPINPDGHICPKSNGYNIH